MNTTPNTTLSTAAASSGGAFSLVVIISYLLSLKGVNLPGVVLTAMTTLITYGIHYLVATKIIPALPPEALKPETKE